MLEAIMLPKWHFKKRIQHQYSNIPLAIAREILQNSQDAGATWVKFVLGDNSFKAMDNGKGMTLDEFRRFYLTLGGTKKDTGSIGGFGAAKELLSFAWESWRCDGQGFCVNGSGADQPESTPSQEQKKGFSVAAQGSNLDGLQIGRELFKLCTLSKLTVKVYVNGNLMAATGRKLRQNQLYRTYEFGRLYVHKSEPNASEQTGYLYIRTRGLFTGSEYIGGDYVYYLELDTASPEVLNENRDTLRYNVKDRIQKDLQALSRRPESVEKKAHNPQVKVYGNLHTTQNTSNVYNQEVGYLDIADTGPALWSKPFVIADNGKLRLTTNQDKLRPKVAKALEIWDTALNLVATLAEIERPVAGLCQDVKAEGVHFQIGDRHVICGLPETILTESPYYVLELALHEFAHYYRAGHSQEYETARMDNLARKVGANALAILETIRRLQA